MPPRPADHLRLVEPPAAPAAAGRAGPRTAKAPPPRRAFGDWVWHGLGGAVAAASAGFATYAMIFSTGKVVPSGNFSVFNGYDHLYQAASAQHAGPARAETAERGGVDFAPTGSLAAGRDAAAQGSTGPGGAGAGRGADAPTLPSFTLRDVFDGKALIESRASLSVVRPGSVLEGAGEILSIEKRGDRWVVVTRNGVIAGQRR